MLALTSLYYQVSRVSSMTRANHTDPAEQEDPIREGKVVGSFRRRTTTYILEARGLDFAIQVSPFEYLRPSHACEKL